MRSCESGLNRGGVRLLAVEDQTDHRGGDGHDLVDGAADGGDGHEKVVDKDQGRGQKDALAEILGIEVAHGQGVEGETHHKEKAVVALPQKGTHDRHDQGQRGGKNAGGVLVLILVQVAHVSDDAHDVQTQRGGAAQHGVGDAGDRGGDGVGHKDLGV